MRALLFLPFALFACAGIDDGGEEQDSGGPPGTYTWWANYDECRHRYVDELPDEIGLPSSDDRLVVWLCQDRDDCSATRGAEPTDDDHCVFAGDTEDVGCCVGAETAVVTCEDKGDCGALCEGGSLICQESLACVDGRCERAGL